MDGTEDDHANQKMTDSESPVSHFIWDVESRILFLKNDIKIEG
jgi:hypothetical protein